MRKATTSGFTRLAILTIILAVASGCSAGAGPVPNPESKGKSIKEIGACQTLNGVWNDLDGAKKRWESRKSEYEAGNLPVAREDEYLGESYEEIRSSSAAFVMTVDEISSNSALNESSREALASMSVWAKAVFEDTAPPVRWGMNGSSFRTNYMKLSLWVLPSLTECSKK